MSSIVRNSDDDPLVIAIQQPRIAIESVSPVVEEGAYPAKTESDRDLRLAARIFADGHEVLGAEVVWRRVGKPRSGACRCCPKATISERAVAHAALRPPVLPYRGLDRPFRRLPPRIACQAWRTPAAGPGAARGRRAAAALRRARRSGDRRRLCAAGRTPAGLPERRGAGGAVAGGADRRTVASGRPARAPGAQPRIPAGGGATAGALRQLVRAVPSLGKRRPDTPRYLRRRDPAPAADRRDGLRRSLFPADPPHRPHPSQGPQQFLACRGRRPRQPVCDRQRGGRPRGDPSRTGRPRGFPPAARCGA